MQLGRLVARRGGEVPSGRDRITCGGCLRPGLCGMPALLGAAVAKVLRDRVLTGVGAVGEIAIAGRLIAVGRNLIVLRRGLVAVSARLGGIRQRLIGIGERLLGVELLGQPGAALASSVEPFGESALFTLPPRCEN